MSSEQSEGVADSALDPECQACTVKRYGEALRRITSVCPRPTPPEAEDYTQAYEIAMSALYRHCAACDKERKDDNS